MKGRIALAGLDESRLELGTYLDIVWVILTEIPHETIEKLVESVQKAEALIDPVGTRKTWGQTEEQLDMAARGEQRAAVRPPTETESGPIHRAGPPPGR